VSEHVLYWTTEEEQNACCVFTNNTKEAMNYKVCNRTKLPALACLLKRHQTVMQNLQLRLGHLNVRR
jgi:hypothetical protein